MPIGKQPFDLPMNSVKKETSIAEKVSFRTHDADGQANYWQMIVDRRLHTKNVKIKLFVAGYHLLSETDSVRYIGQWVELEPYQQHYVNNNYLLVFTPYAFEQQNELYIRLRVQNQADPQLQGEIFVEKISIIDSDFDPETTWLTDDSIALIPIIGQSPTPPEPQGTDPDPNNQWIW